MIKKVRLLFYDFHWPVFISFLKAIRPYQWIKNGLVFVPLLAAHRYSGLDSLLQTIIAFVVFNLTASSVYLFNDLIDVHDDRRHPVKRLRPFAAGDLSLFHGWLVWPLLLSLAFLIAGIVLPWGCFAILLGYFLLSSIYSLYIKRLVIIDVVMLALLYTFRLMMGAVAANIPLSFWLLALSMFIFVSLAFVKRFAELNVIKQADDFLMLPGRGYCADDLGMISIMGVVAGYLAVLVLALYVQDSHTAELYRSPMIIWLACPLLLFWISRVWIITNRGMMDDDPILFALKDKVSWLVVICFVTVFFLAKTIT